MEQMWQTVLLIVTFLWLVHLFKKINKIRNLRKYVEAFPGDKWYPIVGTSWRFLGIPREKSWAVLKELSEKYGPTWRIWSGSQPMILISKVEHLELMFKHTTNINKGTTYRYIEPWLGHGLITASRTNWKGNRRLITPAFHFKVLDKYSKVFSAKAEELASILEKHGCDTYIDVYPYLTRCSLDIIAETAMGVKFNTLKDPDCEYANAIFKLCEVAAKRTRAILGKNDLIFKFTELGRQQDRALRLVKDTNLKIIATRKAEFQNHTVNTKTDDTGMKEKLAFLDLLLENQKENRFTDKEISDEVSTFMFAGQDTTAATVTYTLLALANHPEIQAKVHEELDSIYNGDQRAITAQDVAEMEYLERVIKETLRTFSIVPIIGRQLEEAITIDEKIIPPGVTVQLSIFRVHSDPNHWPDPKKFDPDRFLPENSTNRHAYAFVPFSAGPRNCIGQKFGTRNAKTMVATVLRKFKIKSRDNMENLDLYNEIVLKPQNGVHIKFELRNK